MPATLDLMRYIPAPDSVPTAGLLRLLQFKQRVERRLVWPAYKFLLSLTGGENIFMLYREFFPREWSVSDKSLRRRLIIERRFQDESLFSPRELEFFELVSEHLFPLDVEAYRFSSWEMEDDEDLPCYCELKGLEIRGLDESEQHGVWILYALAHAACHDTAWEYHLHCLGLPLTLLPKWLRNNKSDPKRTEYVRYNLRAIVREMLPHGQEWALLPKAWAYATSRTGSDLFDMSHDDFLEMGYSYPPFSRDKLRSLARDYAEHKPYHDAFYSLASTLDQNPEIVQALIQTVARHTRRKKLVQPQTLAEIFSDDNAGGRPAGWTPTSKSYPPSFTTCLFVPGGEYA